MNVVNVSVAIITDSSERFLITRRALDIPHGGLWEVPGGKVEPEETPYDAIVREVYEEVGLKIQTAKFVGEVRHAYPEKHVCLNVFQVLQYVGEASRHDGQLDLRWVTEEELSNFQFPEANYDVMKLVQAVI